MRFNPKARLDPGQVEGRGGGGGLRAAAGAAASRAASGWVAASAG